MKEFGAYQAISEIAIGPRTTVYQARRKGEADGNRLPYAVKVYENPFLESGEADAFRQEFDASTRAHQTLAERLPNIVLPLLETGEQNGTAWKVTPYIGFTMEQVFEWKLKTSATLIYRFIGQILGQLLQLKNISDRSHGNLKASNIFLEGEGRLDTLKARLADFAPMAGPGDGRAMEQQDMVDLGRLLYHLVTRQPSKSTTVSDTEDWAIFGKKRQAWIAFCEELLKADAPGSSQTLELVVDRLPALKPPRKKPTGLYVSTALLALAGGLVATHMTLPEGIPGLFIPTPKEIPLETQEQWKELVADYNAWGKALDVSLGEAVEQGSGTIWHQHPYLSNEVLDFFERNMDSGVVEMDPWEVVDRRVPWQTLDQTIPDILARSKYVEKTRFSSEFMQFLEVRLEAFTVPLELAELASVFEQRGWQRPAEQIRDQVDEYQLDLVIPDRIRTLLTSLREVNQINRLFTDLNRQVAPLVAEGTRPIGNGLVDPLLIAIPEILVESGRGVSSLNDLVDSLGTLENERAAIEALITSESYQENTARELFRQDPFLTEMSGVPPPQALRQWRELVVTYAYLADEEVPLRPGIWSEQVAAIEQDLSDMRAQNELMLNSGIESPLTDSIFQGYEGELTAVENRAVALVETPAIRRNFSLLESGNAEVLRRLSGLQDAIQAMMERLIPDRDQWLETIMTTTIAGSTVLNDAWERRRDAILAANPRQGWEEDNEAYVTLLTEVRQLRRFLSDLNSPDNMPLAGIDTTGVPGELATRLLNQLEIERERAMEALVALIPETLGDRNAETFLAAPETSVLRDTFDQMKRDAAAIGKGFTAAAGRLDEGFGLADLPGSYFQEWNRNPLFTAVAESGPLRAFRDRMQELLDFREATDLTPEAVLELASRQEAFLALSVEAYRKLQAFTDWPTSAVQFDQDSSALNALLGRTSGDIREAIARMGRVRWEIRLRQAGQPEQLDTVFRFMDAYGIAPDSLEPVDRMKHLYYREIANLRQVEGLREEDGQRVEGRKQEFLRILQQEPAFEPLSQTRTFSAELAAFDPTVEKPEPGGDELGPATVGWTFDRNRSTRNNYIYTWEDPIGLPHELEFLRIENPDGGSFFICTTEVSAMLFNGRVLDLGPENWPEWIYFSGISDLTNDSRNGPRVWESTNGELLPTEDDWIKPFPGFPPAEQLYAFGEPRLPDDRYPMQYVTPELARQFSELMGCRLPSPQVWEYVVNTFPNEDPSDDNIRDQSWFRHREHVETAYLTAAPENLPWPDREGFATYLLNDIPTGSEAEPAAPGINDGVVYFDAVEGDRMRLNEQVMHLYGNVAEYLFDGRDYFIAGTSAMAPPEINPRGYIPITETVPTYGYADVGFRLCFIIDRVPPGIELRNRLESQYAALIRVAEGGQT